MGVKRFSASQQVLNTFGGQFPATQGRIIYCKPASGKDGNDGSTPVKAVKTLIEALSLATAGQNDIVALMYESNTAANTTDYQTATLDWNKEGVHLIGIGARSFLGQRARISQDAASAALGPMFKLSASNCLIDGIELFQGTPASGTTQRCMDVTGQRNVIRRCQISGMGDLTAVADVAGSRSLLLSGSENILEDCYIGLDTALRATMTTEVEISAGARNIFRKCHFETYTSLSTFKMISIATGCDRFVKFEDCDFVGVQNITSAVAPTGLIGITTMNGQVLLRNPYLYGFAQYVTADNAYVRILGFNGDSTTHLVGLAGSVDAA